MYSSPVHTGFIPGMTSVLICLGLDPDPHVSRGSDPFQSVLQVGSRSFISGGADLDPDSVISQGSVLDPDSVILTQDPQPCPQYLAGGVESLPYDEVDDTPGEDEGAQQVPVHAAKVGHAARYVQHSPTKPQGSFE